MQTTQNEKSRVPGQGSGTSDELNSRASVRLTYPTFPCGPDKKPLTKNGFKDASNDPEQIKRWKTRYPDALTGRPTGGGFVVIDTDQKKGKDGEAELATLEETHGTLPPTYTVETMSGGLHRYFTAPDSVTIPCSADKLAHGVDVRGDGGYVIIPPSKGYSVAVDLPQADLPPAWVELLRKREVVIPPPPHRHNTDVDHERVREALRFIPADCSRDDWLRVGMALHDVGLNHADFDAWSRAGGDKYKGDADTLATWQSFKAGNGVTVATLFDMAKRNGFDLVRYGINANHLPPVEQNTGPQIIIKRNRPWCKFTDEQVMDTIEGTALAPIVRACAAPMEPGLPIGYTLPKTLALVGCALSGEATIEEGALDKLHMRGHQRARLCIKTARGQVCNVYAMLCAESSSGKDVGGVVDELSFRRGYALGDTGSAEGLGDALTAKGNGLLVVPEFKNWLDEKHWQHKAGSFMTAVFNRGHFRQRLSVRGKETKERSSDYCFPSIIANVQPGTVERYASTTDIISGLMGRFIFSGAPIHYGRPTCKDMDHLVDDADESLIRYEQKSGQIFVPDGYLADTFRMFADNEAPIVSAWSRLVNEYGPRFAVMLSVDRNDIGTDVTIKDRHWKGAAILIPWLFTHAERLLCNIGDDKQIKQLEVLAGRISGFIHRHPGCNLGDISRNCNRGNCAKQRREAIGELLDRGEIAVTNGIYHAVMVRQEGA